MAATILILYVSKLNKIVHFPDFDKSIPVKVRIDINKKMLPLVMAFFLMETRYKRRTENNFAFVCQMCLFVSSFHLVLDLIILISLQYSCLLFAEKSDAIWLCSAWESVLYLHTVG